MAIGAVLAFAAGVAATVGVVRSGSDMPAPVARLTMALPAGDQTVTGFQPVAALSPDAIFDATTLVVEVPRTDDTLPPLLYRARGRVCREQGWRAVDPPGKSREVDLPNVDRGDRATAGDVRRPAGSHG